MVAKQLVSTIEKVETHPPDPTSPAAGDPWQRVHDHMGELGDRLKETYRKVADDKGPSEKEIGEALSTLADAWDQVASTLSAVWQDPELRRRLKTTAASFAAALGDTIGGAGRELRHDLEEEE
jgi:hypothetical protein